MRRAVAVILMMTLTACTAQTPTVSPTASLPPPPTPTPSSPQPSPVPTATAAPSAAGIEWVRQFGTAGPGARAVWVDASGVYVAGTFVSKYDPAGIELWTRQIRTSEGDDSTGVSADASGVYVVGYANAVPDDSSAGFDALLRKYDPSGTELWTRQFGTGEDRALAISVDDSGVYVAGETSGTLPGQTRAGGPGDLDAFVRKYDPSGTELWTRQFGTSAGDRAFALSVDASGVYVGGETGGAFTGQTSAYEFDAFVRKYDPGGTELWTRQFGSSNHDSASAVSVDASGVYVAGYSGTLPGQAQAEGTDAFVRKYDPGGTELWTRQFTTDTPGLNDDAATAVSVDASGVYVAGVTVGTFAGQTAGGGLDAFVRKYDRGGTELWTRQFGTSGNDIARAIAVNASGVYVAGATDGALPGQTSAGGFDAFVLRYEPGGP